MGNNVSQCRSKFKMKKENVPAAWAALKEYCNQPYEFEFIQRWFQEAAKQDCFEDSMGVLGFIIGSSSRSAGAYYDEIEPANESWSGYESACLTPIAPFVEEGSYMEFHGEDGETWRIVFAEGKANIVYPTVFWNNPMDDIHYLLARLYDYRDDRALEPLELADFCILAERYKFTPKNNKEVNEFYEEYYKKNPEIINRELSPLKKTIERLKRAFPKGRMSKHKEFFAHEQTNQYICLEDCQTPLDVKCKILEQLSREAFKTNPYPSQQKNDELHKYMLSGINQFLNTCFEEEDMELVYTFLGNSCNHEKTIMFIESDYDMDVLTNANLRR